ncbi:hypothetical protein ACFLRY_01915 [Bacteroidota bacterium]
MKSKQFLNILLILLLALTSCREITVSTIINKDGSFTRVVTITGDSSDVFKLDLPYPIDSSWIAISEKDSVNKGDYKLTYTKTFKSSKDLNDEIARDTGWRKQLDKHLEIRKSFGFFYSYPKYKEVFKAANPFSEYDYSDYLNQEDILWLSGQKVPITKADSAKLKSADDRSTEYFVDLLTIEIIKVLEKGLAELDKPELVPQDVILHKDSIKHRLNDDNENLKIFIDYYAKWIDNPAVKELNKIEPPIFQELNKKFKLLLEVMGMESYTVEVELPGIIMETNSTKLKGNKVEWKVDPMSFILEDFEMYVESRIINKWAFYVAGGVLLLLIVLLIIRIRK